MSAMGMNQKITRSQIILFSLRLFFYLSVLVLLAIHPGIAISFDRVGIIQWFVVIPLMSTLAFLLGIKLMHAISLRTKIPAACRLLPAACLIVLSLTAGGFSVTALWPFLAGCISFFLTFLLFNFSAIHGARWGKLSLLEPFFLVWIALRLLALSRSGEEIAGQSAALTQFILVWALAVFLLHGVVVYFCLFPNSKKGAGKEGAVFAAGAIAALVLVLAVLPPDFIRNSIIENINRERAPQRIGEGSDKGIPRDSARRGRRQGDGEGRRPELRGMSEHEWTSNSSRGRGRGGENSEDNRQYMVKIAVSETEPVYMGNVFKGHLDPVEGFLLTETEPLNELSKQRLFVTWRNSERNFDTGRERLEVFSLSTLQEKYFPYWTVAVDPTIISENSGPLRYIHQVVSDIHTGNPLELIYTPSRRFTSREEQTLAPYTEVPLNADDFLLFSGWLENALQRWQDNRMPELEHVNDHLEKIWAVLSGFSEYQYNLSYNEEASIENIKHFLFETKDGDCVEFSNSAALLGRLAGVPSRVVTGFLASEDLQTEAHLRGLANLQRQIPVLQQYPFDNLFMVTNMHAHSWVQFYIPDYGWLDFEATGFALPPAGTGDFNTWDVVIPVIEEKRVFSNLRKFPWRAVMRAAGWMLAAAVVLAYALRYGREAALLARSRSGGRDGARALYLLLLAKLAADGKPIKPASKTAAEYTELFADPLAQRRKGAEDAEVFNHEPHEPHENFRNFASLYSELRWREFEDQNEMEEKFDMLKKEYQNIIKNSKRQGIGWLIIRIISLRGLAYL